MSHQTLYVALWNFKEQCFAHYSVTSSSFAVHADCRRAMSDWLKPVCFPLSLYLCVLVNVGMLLVSVMLRVLHEASLCLLWEGWAPAGSRYVQKSVGPSALSAGGELAD